MHISNLKKSFSIVSIALIIFSYILTSGVLLFNPRAAHAATYTVTNTADSGAGSLRQAIIDANASGGADVIDFSIAGAGPHTLTPASAYPNITEAVTIDGFTEPDATANSAAAPLGLNAIYSVEIDASAYAGNIFVITSSGGSTTIRGLVMNGTNSAISVGSSNNTIAGNYLGTNVAGTVADGFANQAIIINTGTGNIIGGTSPADRNLISGNYSAIRINSDSSDSNIIEGNIIGLNAAGTAAIPNGRGIDIDDGPDSNIIGGTTTNSTNVISGNDGSGIYVRLADTTSNTISGNYIGIASNGTTTIGNAGHGIEVIQGATNTIIGGDTAGERNIISGNGNNGIVIGSSSTTGTTIQGNYIGTNAAGTSDAGNSDHGILAYDSAPAVSIGGSASGEGNIISGNDGDGINLTNGGDLSTILGNTIGLDVTGAADLGNSFDGVALSGVDGIIVGGDTAGERNVISGNNDDGVSVSQSDSNIITGNYIGTDVNGTADLGNTTMGIRLSESATNTIGGTTSAERNIISGNGEDGITLISTSINNTISGNYIGTDVTGSVDLGNTNHGISSGTTASTNTIGGSVAGAGNVISGNNADGIILGSGTGNITQGNYIGTSADGASDLGNTDDGIEIASGSSTNTIGGTTSLERNIISGNNSNGVSINGSDTNTITGNYVGTSANGSSALGNTGEGINLNTADSNIIGGTASGEGNVISNNNNGINSFDSTSTIIQGNYIGTSAAGTADIGNVNDGIQLTGASSATIGGTTSGASNLLSGNGGDGIDLGSAVVSTTIEGNYIGTDINGTADLGNSTNGITIDGTDSLTIGGTTAEARNIISGNNGEGILFINVASGNTISGNYIGTDVNGVADLGNSNDGVSIQAAAINNTIGGTTDGARNVVSGNNGDGLDISSSGNVIAGNYIGTDESGTADLGNTNDGILIQAAAINNTIGGTDDGARNVVSGNGSNGIQTDAASTVIVGNYIGIGSDGTTSIGNISEGIISTGSDTIIGGTTSGSGNVVSANDSNGISISGDSSIVQGNLVGTSADGLTSVGNIGAGIVIFGASGNNATIGGSTSTARNIVAASTGGSQGGVGILILGFGTANTGNKIQGNYIGTNINGDVSTGFGNGNFGVGIVGSAVNNIIGGISSGEGNKIAGNGANGIFVYSLSGLGLETTNNSILGNSITENGSTGIRLADAADGGFVPTTPEPYPNDAGDTDEITNHFMNTPVISAVTSTNGTATITYNLDINDVEVGATGYRVEFFANDAADASGYGEGQTYLGSDTVAGDVTGRQATITLPAGVSGNKFISAVTTMTDASTDGFGHSSEFAADVEATLVTTGSNPTANILATTGRNINWIALVAVILLVTGGLGLYVAKRQQRTKVK